MSKGIYVIAEQRDGHLQKVGLELIGKATELAETLKQDVVAVLVLQRMFFQLRQSHSLHIRQINLASPDKILEWSHDEVTKPET